MRQAPVEEPARPPSSTPTMAPVRDPVAMNAPPGTTTAPGRAAAEHFLVDDETLQVAPGQMRKSTFLAILRQLVSDTTTQELAGTGMSATDCPYIDRWLARYEGDSAAHLERAVRRYAPDAAAASSAGDYLPAVQQRVRQAVGRWRRTGVPDVPEGMSDGMAAGGGTEPGGGEGGGRTESMGLVGGVAAVAGVRFKARGDRGPASGEAAAGAPVLGDGRPLDSVPRGRMERAFGHSFANVRVHDDGAAARAADSFDARAFTVGEHIGFSAGEYQPGSPTGDALLAHELAHVVQQEGAPAAPAAHAPAAPANPALEEDADQAATGAVVGLYGGEADGRTRSSPRMRSALRLSRCNDPPATQSPPRTLAQMRAEIAALRAGISTPLGEADRRAAGAGSGISTAALLDPGGRTRAEQQNYTILNALDAELQQRWAAASGATQQRTVQTWFEEQIGRHRGSFVRAYELRMKWNIDFIALPLSGATADRIRPWSVAELDRLDGIFDRVPRQYLSGIGRVVRVPVGSGFNVAASWSPDEGGTMQITDHGMGLPDDQFTEAVVHEIGHKLNPPNPTTSVGGFELPEQPWLDLSGWMTSTRASLEADTGTHGSELQEAMRQLDLMRHNSSNVRSQAPVPMGSRMVSPYLYERIPGPRRELSAADPQRFVHYDAAHHAEFARDYARSDPGEDLAESFALYSVRPEAAARAIIGDAKYNYLRGRFPDRLRPAAAPPPMP